MLKNICLLEKDQSSGLFSNDLSHFAYFGSVAFGAVPLQADNAERE